MSSPIILRRDVDTLNYLTHKQHIGGLSLTMLKSILKLPQQSHARRSTIMKLITGWNVDGSRYSLYTKDPHDKAKTHTAPSVWRWTPTSTGSANARAQPCKNHAKRSSGTQFHN